MLIKLLPNMGFDVFNGSEGVLPKLNDGIGLIVDDSVAFGNADGIEKPGRLKGAAVVVGTIPNDTVDELVEVVVEMGLELKLNPTPLAVVVVVLIPIDGAAELIPDDVNKARGETGFVVTIEGGCKLVVVVTEVDVIAVILFPNSNPPNDGLGRDLVASSVEAFVASDFSVSFSFANVGRLPKVT